VKYSCCLLLVLALSATEVSARQAVEIYTYDVLPPYAFRDEQGALTGVYIEIVKRALARMPGYSLIKR